MQRNIFNPFQNNFFSRNQVRNQNLQRTRSNEQEERDPLQEEVKDHIHKDTKKILEQSEKKHIVSNTNENLEQAVNEHTDIKDSLLGNEHTVPFKIDERTLKEIQNHYNIGENGRDLNHNINEVKKHKEEDKKKERDLSLEEKITENKIRKSIINQNESLEDEKQESTINNNIKNLGLIIQNTRNTKLFYENLYELCGRKNSQIIIEMVEITETIKEILMKIYVERNGSEYITSQMPINTNIEYKKALSLALREETIALKEFTDFYKEEENQNMKNKINTIILYKICVINLLRLL